MAAPVDSPTTLLVVVWAWKLLKVWAVASVLVVACLYRDLA